MYYIPEFIIIFLSQILISKLYFYEKKFYLLSNLSLTFLTVLYLSLLENKISYTETNLENTLKIIFFFGTYSFFISYYYIFRIFGHRNINTYINGTILTLILFIAMVLSYFISKNLIFESKYYK